MLMERDSPNLLRIVIFALLLQVLCPLFTTIASEYPVAANTATLHAEHHSVTAPVLYKEKEEGEERSEDFTVELVQLIDFTEHSYVLSDYHSFRISPLRYHHLIDYQPPLFALHGVFLI
jgi:hypothetical protein